MPGRNVLYSRSVCGSYNLLVLTSMSNTTRGASWSWLRDACCSCRLVPAAPGQPLSRRCSLRCRQSSSPRSNGITIGSPARRGVRSVIRANTVRQMALSRFCFCSAARRNRSGRRPMQSLPIGLFDLITVQWCGLRPSFLGQDRSEIKKSVLVLQIWWRDHHYVVFSYLKVKSAKCLCLLLVVLVLLFWSWSCKQRSWSWYFHLGVGLKNLVLFTSLLMSQLLRESKKNRTLDSCRTTRSPDRQYIYSLFTT